MRMSTKTLASLLVVTALAAAVPGISGKFPPGKNRRESQFDRLLQRHDRKGELRADILGIDVRTFRSMRGRMAFDELTKRYGFKDARAFRLALLGKLKDELHHRGWSPQRIDQFVVARKARVS